MSARVEVDWGGEHVYLTLQEGTTEVSVSLAKGDVTTLIRQAAWAGAEVEQFAAWMKTGNPASAYRGEPKPGREDQG